MVLARLPACAIFHKLSAGKGAPHTFYSFLWQWPSVPRIVVSMLPFILRILLTFNLLDFFIRSRIAGQPCPL